jgi:hypothetical protein
MDLMLVVTDKFVVAVAGLALLAGTHQHASFEAAELKVRILRAEYESIRAELARHRTESHPPSKHATRD